MPDRVGTGAALLVAGHGIVEANAALIPLLGRIGESLLATSPDWQLRRLSQIAGERDLPDRTGLKRHLLEVTAQDVETLVVVIAGLVTTSAGEIALVTARDHLDNPDDATLSLRWLGERLEACRAERLVVAASFSGSADAMAQRCLAALATTRTKQLVALDCSARPRGETLEALLDGLVGGALDRETGTITLRSLSDHLEHVPGAVLQRCDVPETLASSPPLAGPWDARLSRSATSAPAEPEDLVGIVLPGRFRIDRALAAGSFGRVYVARQLAVDRDVAVKVLATSVDPGSDLGRLFVHEIQSVGRLDHPNIVRVYQADITVGGRLFYAMELLDGRDLQQVIEAEGLLAKERAVGLAIQLLRALAAAHDVGLVHADVKPANAFIATNPSGEERLVLLDFGFARLRRSDQPVDSAGGTPAYMAPEQLQEGRVDHRSDVFAAALVLVTMLTGWRRKRADALIPPLDEVSDDRLREVLRRALSLAPNDRYASAAKFAEALGAASLGGGPEELPPFRHLAPFTERDRDRLHGRDRDLATLVEHALYRRAVIYTAPSGTGKTSLLRAGLIARLETLGVTCTYLVCRDGAREQLSKALSTAAIGERRTVIVVDQLEAILAATGDESVGLLQDLAAIESMPAAENISLVVSVREDFLATAIAAQGLGAVPVLRLGPLRVDAARDAIVKPLTEKRLGITEELLQVLLADLEAAAASLAPELKWTGGPVVYPPHLQLVCAVLYESLQPGESLLELRHYRTLGGLDAVVGEYLERVLEAEVPSTAASIARSILLSLVNTNQTRAFRTESELATTVSGATVTELGNVLEVLRSRGIVVRLQASTGEIGWELVHDSLVPRVLGWLDRADLARRRALELVRYRVRRSSASRPSLLNGDELRELRDHHDALAELDAEWDHRGGGPIRPSELVRLSLRRRRMRIAAIIGVSAISGVVAIVLLVGWLAERALSNGDIGLFTLEIQVLDRKDGQLSPSPVAHYRTLEWEIYDTSVEDAFAPGSPLRHDRRTMDGDDTTLRWEVQARGGDAILVVGGRGRDGAACPRSIVPIARLPGYATRSTSTVRRIRIPSCGASSSDAIEIEAGPFISGGLGDSPPPFDENLAPADIPPETNQNLSAYAIDRTEVTNAAFRSFSSAENDTRVAMPVYPPTKALHLASSPRFPVSDVTWNEARAFCRFHGRELPTSAQWEKALRGGVTIRGESNPAPRRTLLRAHRIDEPAHPVAEVSTTSSDSSPYGVRDLEGNVQEWTDTETENAFRVVRGCGWMSCSGANILQFMSIPNARAPRFHYFELGFRCGPFRSLD